MQLQNPSITYLNGLFILVYLTVPHVEFLALPLCANPRVCVCVCVCVCERERERAYWGKLLEHNGSVSIFLKQFIGTPNILLPTIHSF